MVTSLHTERLVLRPWTPQDLEPFAKMNADVEVTKFLPAPLNREQSDLLAAGIRAGFENDGFGLWAVERVDDPAPFIGFIGLNVPRFASHFTPCVEIGWRLAFQHWGVGFATEGASAVLRHAFEDLRLREILAFTVPANGASIRVMEKIGMKRDVDGDFDHPGIPKGDRLRKHLLFRCSG